MQFYYRSIIITAPYGEYIRNGDKTIIVKTKYFKTLVAKTLLLIEGKKGIGIILLAEPVSITLDQFKKLYKYHRITEDDRIKWWNGYTKLYAYKIIKTHFYKIPILLGYNTGPQVTVLPENTWIKKVHIGTSGLMGKTFESYAKTLNSVEINYTFYKFPSHKFVNNLKQYDLNYTIKVHKIITHNKQLHNIKTVWKEFYELFRPISDKIVCFLFQFGARFTFNMKNFLKLKQLSQYLDDKHKYAFEFRNKEWYDNQEVNKLFLRNSWTLVIVHINNIDNWAGNMNNGFSPKLSQYVTTSNLIYFRLHGTIKQYEGSYNKSLLNEIVNFISSKPIQTFCVYFNNTDSDDAWPNAQKLMKMLNQINVQ